VHVLAWDGLLNVRDLGGHATEDGGETRRGAVVRADSVRRMSDAGWTQLLDFGIRTVVDLRCDEELATDPPVDLPVEVVHVPLLPWFDSLEWEELDELVLAAPDHTAAQTASYLAFLARYPTRFAAAVAAVAEAAPGGVLVHCRAGKDRTGLVAALLLRLAGVGVETIAEDYALSAANLGHVLTDWIAAGADDRQRELRTRVSASPRSAMVAVLGELEERHGDVRSYLLAAGASPAALQRARSRLRE
jgi:protein-tyrosine phosphatase